MVSIPLLALAMALTGLVGGVVAGLLGVGGGIVVVPVLDAALQILNVDPAVRLHVAVATSLATIIPTSISSARAHHKKGAVDFDLAKRWAAAIFVGAVIGTILASRVETKVLSAVFAVTAILVGIKMLLPTQALMLNRPVPTGPISLPIPALIGGVSTMMGIGGGTLTVPILNMYDYPIHRAVGTASFFGLIISIPGTIGFIVGGWEAQNLPPGSLGFVNLIGFALIAPTSWLAAPWGARLAHNMSRRALSIAFGVFLLCVGTRMALRVLGS